MIVVASMCGDTISDLICWSAPCDYGCMSAKSIFKEHGTPSESTCVEGGHAIVYESHDVARDELIVVDLIDATKIITHLSWCKSVDCEVTALICGEGHWS